jgi:YD repeat-containing protein
MDSGADRTCEYPPALRLRQEVDMNRLRANQIPVRTLALLVTLLLVSAAPLARAQVSGGPTTPLLDDFERPNENPLSGGGNWAKLNPTVAHDLELTNGAAWQLLISTTDSTYPGPGHVAIGIGTGADVGGPRIEEVGAGTIGQPPPASGPTAQARGTCTGRGSHALTASSCLSDPVNTLSGAFITSVDDLATPGTGVPFAWSRSYTSEDATVGRLGPGWTDSYATSLLVQGSGDVIVHGDEGQQVYYTKQGDGSFVGAAGSLSTLSAITGGYRLVRSDQVTYLFDTSGRLTSVKDRNTQGLTFAYDGSGRLTTITDAAGRQVSLTTPPPVSWNRRDERSASYGYSSGHLTSVTDVRGKVDVHHDAGGRLATIVDPKPPQVTNVFMPTDVHRRRTRSQNDDSPGHWHRS